MSWLRRLRWQLTRKRREAELRAELEFHLEEEQLARASAGVAEADARRAARLDLGNVALVEEDTRAAWSWRWLAHAAQDLRYAARLVRRRPGISLTAIVTLTLGIGANTAVFSLLDALLIRPLPVARSADLVRLVEGRDADSYRDAFTLETAERIRRASTTLSGVIASSVLPRLAGEIVEGDERPRVFLQFVSDNYFDVLGVSAFRGRVWHTGRAGAADEAVAVISDDYWRRHFNRSGSAIGARFQRGNREFTIVGVTPPEFRGLELDIPVDIWVSIDQFVPANSPDRTRGRWMRVTGRLAEGSTIAGAAAESSAIVGRPVAFERGAVGYSTLRRTLSQPIMLVGVVVLLVLLIACANLANLMLASTMARRREFALRTAIGASRPRIIWQVLTESLVLSALGGVLAIGAAYLFSAALLGYLPADQAIALPNLRFSLNPRVAGVAAALSCLTCVLCGLLPAIRATSTRGATDLKTGIGAGERTRTWTSRTLIVTQVVLCTTIVSMASVFLRSLQNLRHQDTGYVEDHLLIADVQLPRPNPNTLFIAPSTGETMGDRALDALVERVAALPGVAVAAFSHVGQLSGNGLEYRIGFPDRPVGNNPPAVMEQRISAGFFNAMGTTVVAGRDFNASDSAESTPVAIVNEAFAHWLLGGRDPIGAKFYQEGGSRDKELMTVVGVVRDSKWINLRDESPPMYYRPYRQQGGSPMVRLVLRTAADPSPFLKALPIEVRASDRRLVVTNIALFSDVVNRTLVVERLTAQVSAAFGALALIIAAVGLYGMLAYGVARRRREIGLRMAVGAEPRRIGWMFLRESLTLVAIGIAIGVPAAVEIARLVSSILFGLSPHDTASLAIALVVMVASAIAASYFPARRAAGIDVTRALRQD